MESDSLIDGHQLKFVCATKKLLTLTQHRVHDKTKIEVYLRELNQLNYQLFSIREDDTVKLLINRLCSNIQAQETSLVTLYSLFLSRLLTPSLALSGRTLSTLKRWLYQTLNFSALSALPPTLLSLQKLISLTPFDSTLQDLDLLLPPDALLPKFLTLRASPPPPQSIQHLTLTLLDTILLKNNQTNSKIPQKHLKSIKNLVISVLSSPPRLDQWSPHHSKVTLTALKTLTTLITHGLTLNCPELPGETLGIIQVYLFLGIPGFPVIKPEGLHPTVMNLPERVHLPPRGRNKGPVAKSRGNKGKKLEKNKSFEDFDKKIGIFDEKLREFSDSETSDSEKWSQEKFLGKIRYQGLQLLQEMMREMGKKEFFGFWSQIVTRGGNPGESRGLLRFIMKEPLAKGRQSGLGVLSDGIVDARMFLVHADEAEGSSFVTIFGAVGGMLREIHQGLGYILSSEGNYSVVTQALKCSAAVVQVTPYGRMKEGLAGKLARHCRFFLLHKDPTVRVVAISVFEAFANVENMTPEVLDILFRKSVDTNLSKKLKNPQTLSSPSSSDTENDEEVDFSDLDTSRDDSEGQKDLHLIKSHKDTENSAFLVQICLNNISDKKIHIPVRLQSFKLLGALINCLEGNPGDFLDVGVITRHLIEATSEPDPQIALHACRVLEIISSKLSGRESKGQEGLLNLWNSIFAAILGASQSGETVLREVACDCFGTISNEVFTQLSLDKSTIIRTTLFSACRDEESAVRAAGLRALGMLINLPSLEEDTGFLEDLAEIVCTSLNDENLGVRVKSAWALANLTDCLIKQDKNDDIEPLPLDLILPNLYRTSVKAAQDTNKVKCNALRAVGNILHLSQGRNILGDVESALKVLISSATSGNDMKVRWNACRALGFTISHNPDDIFPQDWKDQVIPSLCDLICYSPNFKVRTNAAWALGSCESYGKYVPSLWKSIVLALENSQHVPNFVEYTHRESLVQQLCLTLCHVAARTDPGDLQSLWLDIKDHVEEIEGHMKNFQERVLPEKTDDFVRAKLIMKNYSQTLSLGSDERFIADVLGNLFNSRSFYEEL